MSLWFTTFDDRAYLLTNENKSFTSPHLLVFVAGKNQNLISRGEGCLVEARVCRVHRKQGTSELEAIRVSEALPFMVCDPVSSS